MGNHRDALAIRAILVGTRAAVRSHRVAGTPELIHASAERGSALLDELSARIGKDADPQLRDALDRARLEIDAILESAADPRPDQVTPPR